MPDQIILPPWYLAARKEIGTREEPDNTGPAIRRYIAMAHCGHEHDPWCAIFMNAMLESTHFPGTRSPSSQSFRQKENANNFVQLRGPALGAIAVFWRTSHASGLGHVATYSGEDAHGFIKALGGNESDMVREEFLNPNGSNFGLVGYYWPRSYPLPQIGRIIVPHDIGGTGKVV